MAYAYLIYLFIFSIIITINANQSDLYNIDADQELGRQFDGIGGLSGGGATSKLLINYAEPYRNQILDYLFKPNFGASLQILKVEIGGDAQSTDGTESSHQHEEWDENYSRGYEWWLMVEAKKRNADIKLYALPWAFPGWISNGSSDPYKYPDVLAEYIVKWVIGAQKYYNLTIDYVGIWNERQFSVKYIKTLRSVLDKHGHANVEIVAADNAWFIAGAILQDEEVAKAVSVIGAHYPGTNSSKIAQKTNKPMWSSEDYSTFNDGVGAGCWARILNQNYVNGLMTSTISWNLIASYYQDLPFGRNGLMTAQEPWSGHYQVEDPIWITAHTTHFTSPGWRYLAHGSGVGHLAKGGSYVTMVDPSKKHFTIIIETMSHDHSICIRPKLPAYNVKAQTVTFTFNGALAAIKKLYVWHTKLNFDGTPSKLFQQKPAIEVVGGKLTLQLDVDEIYSLTTVIEPSSKPYPGSPDSQSFPIPYGDDFEDYKINGEAYNFVPQVGVWEIQQAYKAHKSAGGYVNRQVMLHDACYWCNPGSAPINIGGDFQWTNIFIQMDVYIPSINGTDGVFLAARVTKGGCSTSDAKGIFFVIYAGSNNYTLYSDYEMKKLVTHGELSETIQRDTWYHLGLVVTGIEAYGFFDVNQIFQVKIPAAPTNGFAAYGATSYGLADYDNLMILDSSINKS